VQIAAVSFAEAILSGAADMSKTKKIAICAMMSALGASIMYVGSLFGVFDISAACISSFIVLFVLIELGTRYSLCVYAVTSVLSFIVVTDKLSAYFYILFFGLMPITKRAFETLGAKVGMTLSYIAKIATFNVELLIFGYFTKEIFLDIGTGTELIGEDLLIAVYFVLANVIFILADILYGTCTRIYFFRFRKRIEKFLR